MGWGGSKNRASIFSKEAASLPSLNSVVVVIWCRQQVWLWFFIGFIVSCLKPLGYGFIFFVFVGKMSNFVGTLAIVFLLLLRLLCSVNEAATHLIFKWSHLPKRTSLKMLSAFLNTRENKKGKNRMFKKILVATIFLLEIDIIAELNCRNRH